MTPTVQLTCVIAVLFLATLTRSTFGFGEALVAVPLLALVLKLETASALVAITSICNSFIIIATSRNSIVWRGSWWLIVSSVAGIPVGVYVLTHVPEVLVKRLLAGVIVTFALYNLSGRQGWRFHSDAWAFPFGFLGGILSGAYNMAGPPLVIFATLRGWTPDQFRSTLQGVFLTNAVVVLGMHYWAGLWSSDVVKYVGWVPLVLAVTVPLGFWISRRIHPEHFRRILHGLLLALGLMLAWSTLAR